MSLTIHVEEFDHPNDPDVGIQITTKREDDMNYHTCIDLSQDEADQLLTLLRGVVE